MPSPPQGLVSRPRVEELVTQGIAGLLTLVSAHAGTGKTVLLSSWAAHRSTRRAVVWVSLDRGDNWSPRFWAGVEDGLARTLNGNGRKSRRSRRGQDPIRHVIDQVERRSTPLVLVLDDFHEIENPVVRREVQELLDYAPPHLRIVLSTRADPSLRLERLRLSGAMTEIRAAELAFTLDDCKSLLGPLADELSEDDIEALCARTEGWAAGIRLASLSLEGQEDKSQFVRRFAGDDRAVADYLLREILSRQSPSRREFLLRTSLPDSLTPELADALMQHEDGARVLVELQTENFLVTGDNGTDGVYCYHGLLREFLRTQLARTHPGEVRALRRRTAHWERRSGDPVSAFGHAVTGEDWDLAEAIYAESWLAVYFAAGATGSPSLSDLPADVWSDRKALCHHAALAALLAGDRDEADRRLALAGQDLGTAGTSPELLRVLREGTKLMFTRLGADQTRLVEAATDLSDAVGEARFGRPPAPRAIRALALSHQAIGEVTLGELDNAELHLDAARAVAEREGCDQVVLDILGQLALIEATRGRLRRAAELGTDAAQFAARRGWEKLAECVAFNLALGIVHRHWGEGQTAAAYFVAATEAARASGDVTGLVAGTVLSSLEDAASGARAAERGLRSLRGIASELAACRPPALLAGTLATAEARLLAARGDLVAAREALPADATAVAVGVVRARLSLAEGNPSAALDELECARATPPTEVGLGVEAAVLEAVARHELHDAHESAAAVEQALVLAGPEAYRRQFLDGGPAVRSLLVDKVRHGTSHRSQIADLIAAFDHRAASVEITKPELLEPLSPRERAILRYLPTMMSNEEIASELFLSVNTVKTHLRNVYRKLGARKRRDAVERARSLDLL